MHFRHLSVWHILPLMITLTLVIGVVGMLIRGRDAAIAVAGVALVSGAGLASWMMIALL